MTDERLAGRFRRWLWRPPRPHGESTPGRTVSFLELFYDLVYVAVVSQAANHLAERITLRSVGEFSVVFALIWIGWINGTLYLELHGREDGRTRTWCSCRWACWFCSRCSRLTQPATADAASPSRTRRSRHC